MSYPVTRVTVKDTHPERPVMSIGRIYSIVEQPPEVIFRTVEDEPDAETKVVKPRGRRPAKSNEDAETK